MGTMVEGSYPPCFFLSYPLFLTVDPVEVNPVGIRLKMDSLGGNPGGRRGEVLGLMILYREIEHRGSRVPNPGRGHKPCQTPLE